MASTANNIIIGVGEILWDLLPAGRQLGGAPANFAYHAHALGANALPVARVGNDSDGRGILAALDGLGLSSGFIQVDAEAPTGTVTVELHPGGGHSFTIHEEVAWDRLEVTDELLDLAATADAICFGTLGQRCAPARSAIRSIVKAVPTTALRIFDVNLRQAFYSRDIIERSLSIANVLKINDDELPILWEMFGLWGEPAEGLAQLANAYGLRLVALTRGAAGSVLYAGGRVSEVAGESVAIVDTIGAGDGFTAAMALGWLAGWELDRINRTASEVASYICTRPGATPPLPDHLSDRFG